MKSKERRRSRPILERLSLMDKLLIWFFAIVALLGSFSIAAAFVPEPAPTLIATIINATTEHIGLIFGFVFGGMMLKESGFFHEFRMKREERLARRDAHRRNLELIKLGYEVKEGKVVKAEEDIPEIS